MEVETFTCRLYGSRQATQYGGGLLDAGATQLGDHQSAQPAVPSVIATRLVPDHVDGQRRHFERQWQHLQPQLLHQRRHARWKYAQQIRVGDDRGYFEKLAHMHGLVHAQFVEIRYGAGQVLYGAPTVRGHEFLLPQIIQCNARFHGGMSAPRHEHQMVIEELPVYEWIEGNWQPVDGQVYDAVAQAVLEVHGDGNSIEG